jgi:uncharacterized membrane protein
MAASDATESRETLVIVGYTVPIAILVMSTVLRLWVKITQDRLHLDDYLITLASVSFSPTHWLRLHMMTEC